MLKRRDITIFGFLFIFTVFSGAATQAQSDKLVPLPSSRRKTVVARTLVFPRTQSQYSLYFNYTHWYTPEWDWLDRPLFFDASLTPPKGQNPKVYCPSFNRVVQTALPYEVDGFSALAPGHAQRRYLQAIECLNAHPVKDFSLVLGIGGVGGKTPRQAASDIAKVLKAGLASDNAMRIDGKLLIASYRLDADSPEKWEKILKILHKRFGDTFVLVAAVDSPWWGPYMRGKEGKIQADDLAKLEDELRSWLDVCDGIMYAMAGHATDPTRNNKLAGGFYTYLTRVMAEVLNEPKYQNKYFGLQAAMGYFRPITSLISDENGTKYFRRTFDIALDAHPDFLIIPEWDEMNESTAIEPTVYNSLTSRRIVRCYMRRIKDQPQTPMEGDDTSIPNLVVSYRAFLQLGRPLQVEVLNVPDGLTQGNYTLELSLKDIDHNVIKTLPSATLTAEQLKDYTFSIPTAPLAKYSVLMPSLKVTLPDGRSRTFEDGLMCIRLNATANWNKKWVKTPLRDLLQPKSVSFGRIDDGQPTTGAIQVSGNIKIDQAIASVEVVADGRELYAVDPSHKYELKSDEALILLMENAPEMHRDTYNGKYNVTGGEIRAMTRQFGYWLCRSPGESAPSLDNNPRGEIFVVNNKDQAVIHVENDIYKTSVPVAEILKNGVYSESHGRAVTLTIQPYHALPEMPPPLDSHEASFQTSIDPMRLTTAIQMRVIAKSGKMYRSWPILVHPKAQGDVSLPIWSYDRSSPVTVKVDRSRIVHIDNTLASTFGATIHGSADPSYFARVGGVPPTSYIIRRSNSYPKNAVQTSPKRATEDGVDCWSFDGRGNFIYMPPNSLPRGAFTLSFTIKPMSDRKQTLLTSYGTMPGIFTLTMDHGRLTATYHDKLRRTQPYYHYIQLDPELSIPMAQWSTVRITYDLEHIIFAANGKTSKPIPLSTTGRIYTPLIFGGYGTDNAYFKGFLRDLKITHNVVPWNGKRDGSN